MLVLFRLYCLQMLVFKYSVELSLNVLSFSVVRKDFKTFAFLDEDWCTLGLPHLNSFHF